MTTIAVMDAITTLNQAESRLNLERNSDLKFFNEWFEQLPHLSTSGKQALDRIKTSYLYHRADGVLPENTINFLVTSPLLSTSGLFDPPFKISTELPIEIAIETDNEILKGRIDVLVVQNQFWLLVVESKRTTFPHFDAIPQALASENLANKMAIAKST